MSGIKHILAAFVLTLSTLALSAGPFASQAQAATIEQELAGVQVNVPDDWAIDATSPDALVLAASDQSVVMMLTVVKPDELEPALAALDQEMASLLDNLETSTEPEQTEFNGMMAILMDGRGTLGGEPVDVGLALVQTPSNEVMIVLSVTNTAKGKATTQSVRTVLESLEPMS